MDTLLVIDVGNSNIVLGVYEDDRLLNSWRLATSRDRTADEYGILATQLLGEELRSSVRGAIVSSVVPPLHYTIRTMVQSCFGIDPVFVEAGIKTGLSIKTENPLEVGADRIVNAVAAHQLYGGTMIVVDFGTATTFDLVTAKAEYRGGVIAPGLSISAEALFMRAARLPRVEIRRPAHLVGTNTVASMQSGLFWGYIGLVEGIIQRIRGEEPAVERVVATGSFAPLIHAETKSIDVVDLELTLTGLKIIYERNAKGRGRRG
ncbi:MAG: type III pantothenate kinase [Thermoanaerobaculia bacterium]